MIGIFIALDLFLYYGFWELSLVPMTLLIAPFGPNRRRQAAIKFFLYTFIPSAILLVAILWLYTSPAPSTSPPPEPSPPPPLAPRPGPPLLARLPRRLRR